MSKLKRFYKSQKGFTLVEILVVIVIIGILFTVLLPRIDFASEKARQTGVKTDFRTYMTAAEQYLRETAAQGMTQAGFNTYLDKSNQIPSATTTTISTMTAASLNKKDPWGTAYRVEITDASATKGQFVFTSYGKKGVQTTPDFIAAVYYLNGTVESCTYGFDNNANINLSSITPTASTGYASATQLCGGNI